jgi:Arc/MetJ family transcription regulator
VWHASTEEVMANPGYRAAEERAGTPHSLTINESAVGRAADALVYHWCMSRTNIDIDEQACRLVMERYHLATKRDAVNFALRTVAGEPLSLDKARQLRGSGWNGDLDEMRTSRAL